MAYSRRLNTFILDATVVVVVMIETVKKYIYFVEWKTFVVSFWVIVAIIYQNVKMAILISDVDVHCTTC